jgi:hypothetical protein
MSTLTLLDALERPSILGPDRPHEHEHEHEHGRGYDDAAHDHDHDRDDDRDRHQRGALAVGGAPTLDDLLTGAWSALTSGRSAACPLCDGHLEPRYGAGHAAVAGRCTSCDTELS